MRSVRPSEQLRSYLLLLAGEGSNGQFIEVRWPAPAGTMRRHFFATAALGAAAWRIAGLAPRRDVYIGVALRDSNKSGGRSAISGCRFAYVETDQPDTGAALAAFPCLPTIEVASGTPGHRHLYWQLTRPAAPEEVESLNRRLARVLDGDPASVDIARILRPPGTLNHKRQPPGQVNLLALRSDVVYEPEHLATQLPADPQRRPRGPGVSQRHVRSDLDRRLLSIPAADYVQTLTGATPNAAGKIKCPFHEDRTPSLHFYPDGTFACFGRGCHKAGTIYDFAAAWWGTGTRGQEFLRLRQRLARTFCEADGPR